MAGISTTRPFEFLVQAVGVGTLVLAWFLRSEKQKPTSLGVSFVKSKAPSKRTDPQARKRLRASGGAEGGGGDGGRDNGLWGVFVMVYATLMCRRRGLDRLL